MVRSFVLDVDRTDTESFVFCFLNSQDIVDPSQFCLFNTKTSKEDILRIMKSCLGSDNTFKFTGFWSANKSTREIQKWVVQHANLVRDLEPAGVNQLVSSLIATPEEILEEENLIIQKSKEREDFVTLEDGFVYFWPKNLGGYLTSFQLRTLAGYLDSVNSDWEAKIREDLQKLNEDEITTDELDLE